MLNNLNSALAEQGITAEVKKISLGELAKDDYLTGYGTPTVLVNNNDLFGLGKPAPATPM